MLKVVLFFLIGLCLLVGGITSYMTLMITGYSLMLAGILTIILAIAMAMMKEKMKDSCGSKIIFFLLPPLKKF